MTDNPYEQTRTATAGPDVVASFMYFDNWTVDPATVDAIVHLPGVVGHTGPYPLAYTTIEGHGQSKGVAAEGRAAAPAAIDQPQVPDPSQGVEPVIEVQSPSEARSTGLRYM